VYIVTATVTPLVLTLVTCQLSLPLGPLAVAVRFATLAGLFE